MARRMLTLALLLAVETACPHAWRRGGTIDQAAERDMIEYYAARGCRLELEDWEDVCRDFDERKNNPTAQQLCPPECRPPSGKP